MKLSFVPVLLALMFAAPLQAFAEDVADAHDCAVLSDFWQGGPMRSTSGGANAAQLAPVADLLTAEQATELRADAHAKAGRAFSLSCAWNAGAPQPQGFVRFTRPIYTRDGVYAAFVVVHAREPLNAEASSCLMRREGPRWRTLRCAQFYIS